MKCDKCGKLIRGGPKDLRKHKQEHHSYWYTIYAPVCYIVENSSAYVAKIEHPERYSWWLNELESLGVDTLNKDGLNNHKEASDLTEAVKQTLYEDYLQAYSESNK